MRLFQRLRLSDLEIVEEAVFAHTAEFDFGLGGGAMPGDWRKAAGLPSMLARSVARMKVCDPILRTCFNFLAFGPGGIDLR